MKPVRILVAAAVAAIPAALLSFSSGPDPRHTGAPGDQTCAQAGCHTGTALNGGGGSVALTSSTGATYAPGQQQTFTLTITDSRARVYGFQMTARLDSNSTNGQAGDFTAAGGQVVLCDNGSVKTSRGCPASAPIQFIEHSSPSSSKTFNITWTPPASDAGTITIYAAANAANGDGNDTGDHIYTTKLQLAPAIATANKPAIKSGGVAAASAFNSNAGVSPGTWIEIFGSNLSAGTRVWQASDFTGTQAPAGLDDVLVTIGGVKAYVDYISPTQVNAQVPEGITIGSNVPLVVQNSQGASDPYPLTTSTLAPALLAPTSFQVAGKQYVAATFSSSDGSLTFVGAAGSIAGVNLAPAKPGDVITLYGIGFGPVSPATPAGTIDTGATTVTHDVKVLFGQASAQLLYAGEAPGLVGLYQFNVVVPNVMPGDWPLVVTIDGNPINQTLFITTTTP
jgi:uncharacterized protein (TIGR03437 family)